MKLYLKILLAFFVLLTSASLILFTGCSKKKGTTTTTTSKDSNPLPQKPQQGNTQFDVYYAVLFQGQTTLFLYLGNNNSQYEMSIWTWVNGRPTNEGGLLTEYLYIKGTFTKNTSNNVTTITLTPGSNQVVPALTCASGDSYQRFKTMLTTTYNGNMKDEGGVKFIELTTNIPDTGVSFLQYEMPLEGSMGPGEWHQSVNDPRYKAYQCYYLP